MRKIVALLAAGGVLLPTTPAFSQSAAGPEYAYFQTKTGRCEADAGLYNVSGLDIRLGLWRDRDNSGIKFIFDRPENAVVGADGAAIGKFVVGATRIPTVFQKTVTEDNITFDFVTSGDRVFSALLSSGIVGLEAGETNRRTSMFASGVPTFTIRNADIKRAFNSITKCNDEVVGMKQRKFCIEVPDFGNDSCGHTNEYEWRSMIADGKKAMFVDYKSINRNGSIVSAWVYSESFVISNPGHAMIFHFSTDCKTDVSTIISTSVWTYSGEMVAAEGAKKPAALPKESLIGKTIQNICSSQFAASPVNPTEFVKNYRVKVLKLHSDGKPIGPYDSTAYE